MANNEWTCAKENRIFCFKDHPIVLYIFRISVKNASFWYIT